MSDAASASAPADSPRSRRWATAGGIVAVLLWASTVALARSLAESLGAMTAAAVAYGAGGLVGCAYLAATGRLRQALAMPRLYLWGCGAVFVAYIVCIYMAVGLAAGRQQAVEVGIINYLWPALTTVLAVPILHVRVRATLVPGVLMGLAGAVLAPLRPDGYSAGALTENLRQHPAPYVLALVAAVLWGLYSNLSRRWAARAAGDAVPLFVLATGVVLACVRLVRPEESHWTGRAVAEVALVALFPTLIAYALWDVGVRRGNYAVVTSFAYLTPVLSTIVSALYLGVAVGWNVWAACALVVAGAVVCRRAVVDESARG
jgi:drug/metabolite transporter (DMT)-like permease